MLFKLLLRSRLADLEHPKEEREAHLTGPRDCLPVETRVATVPPSKGGYGYAAAMPEQKPEPLTRSQKEQLEAELAELEGPRRRAIVQAIATARGFGDLSENFEYHSAKNEQGLLERRIRMLRDRLQRAVIVDESDRASGTVGVGSSVEFEDEQGERMQVEISSVGGVSPDSPVGQALMGRKVGDEVTIEAPRGAWRARIITVG